MSRIRCTLNAATVAGSFSNSVGGGGGLSGCLGRAVSRVDSADVAPGGPANSVEAGTAVCCLLAVWRADAGVGARCVCKASHAATPSCKHHRTARAARSTREENRQPARKLAAMRNQKDVIAVNVRATVRSALQSEGRAYNGREL
eukprot:1801031-Rhodomonas_salina.1